MILSSLLARPSGFFLCVGIVYKGKSQGRGHQLKCNLRFSVEVINGILRSFLSKLVFKLSSSFYVWKHAVGNDLQAPISRLRMGIEPLIFNSWDQHLTTWPPYLYSEKLLYFSPTQTYRTLLTVMYRMFLLLAQREVKQHQDYTFAPLRRCRNVGFKEHKKVSPSS